MNRKRIFNITMMGGLALVVLIGMYVNFKTPPAINRENLGGNVRKKSGNIVQKENIIKNKFSIELPKGWKDDLNATTSIKVVNINENKVENYSFYSIDLYDINKGDLSSIKYELQRDLPDVEFNSENSSTINGNEAYVVEGKFSQAENKYRFLSALIKGNEDEKWKFFSRSLESNWEDYRGLFYQVLKSFQLR